MNMTDMYGGVVINAYLHTLNMYVYIISMYSL